MGDQHCHCGCLVGVCAGKILWPGVLSPCTSAQAERRPALEREWTMSGSIRRCNDPAVPAQVRPLRHRPRRVSSCPAPGRSEEHTSELQSLMRISYAVFCLKKKKKK